MKIIAIKSEPCKCNAYHFPHRANSGKCDNPGEDPGSCEDCSNALSTSDPYSTGDSWYSLNECSLNTSCPWGHNE